MGQVVVQKSARNLEVESMALKRISQDQKGLERDLNINSMVDEVVW